MPEKNGFAHEDAPLNCGVLEVCGLQNLLQDSCWGLRGTPGFLPPASAGWNWSSDPASAPLSAWAPGSHCRLPSDTCLDQTCVTQAIGCFRLLANLFQYIQSYSVLTSPCKYIAMAVMRDNRGYPYLFAEEFLSCQKVNRVIRTNTPTPFPQMLPIKKRTCVLGKSRYNQTNTPAVSKEIREEGVRNITLCHTCDVNFILRLTDKLKDKDGFCLSSWLQREKPARLQGEPNKAAGIFLSACQKYLADTSVTCTANSSYSREQNLLHLQQVQRMTDRYDSDRGEHTYFTILLRGNFT